MAIRSDAQLDYRTCVTQVERALVNRLSLAFKERLPPAQTIADLRNVSASQRYPMDPIFVQEVGKVYQWTPALVEPDNDGNIIAPLDWKNQTTGELFPGRWVQARDESRYADRTTKQAVPLCMVRDGYLRSVELYQGRPDTDDLWKRFTGLRPLLAIRYEGDIRKLLNANDSIYRIEMNFQLLGLSYHPRRGSEALTGSDIRGEDRNDPGLFQILGDADDCAQGQSHPESGYYHLVPGVLKVLPTGHKMLQEVQSERLFLGSAGITVICNAHRPDYDATTLYSVGLETQQVVTAPDGTISDVDCLLDGLAVDWPGPRLVTVGAGTVRIAGARLEIAATTLTLAAASDTYRYADPEGRLRLISIPSGSPQPDTPSGTLLIGKTQTDSASVLFDEILCPLLTEIERRDIDTVVEGKDL
jgi:hypothetical protein